MSSLKCALQTPVFQSLALFWDHEPKEGPANMSIDEAVLRSCPSFPVLRFYNWAENWASVGYFQRKTQFPQHAELQIVRRWTGGGLVDHRHDHTYSLMVPRTNQLAQLPVRQSYCQVHHALNRALNQNGIDSQVASAELATGASACFAGDHAEGDILLGMQKIAGAAQRRSKFGLLHQGSLLLPDGENSKIEAIWTRFATELAPETTEFEFSQVLEAESRRLAAEKYG